MGNPSSSIRVKKSPYQLTIAWRVMRIWFAWATKSWPRTCNLEWW
jgi:hypothetical protein